MSGGASPLGALEPQGWSHNEGGEIADGRPQSNGGYGYFKHTRTLQAKDVWKMKVVAGGGASIGIAGEGYDVERHYETYKSTAYVLLSNGSSFICSDISEDGETHGHSCLLEDRIPKTLPYDLALRMSKDGNMPQLRFNEDGEWHDFAPEGGTGLKAGPWFPYLMLFASDRLSDHRVNRPKGSKSAGKTKTAPAATASDDGAGAGAAVDTNDDAAPPSPHKKKARHDALDGSD